MVHVVMFTMNLQIGEIFSPDEYLLPHKDFPSELCIFFTLWFGLLLLKGDSLLLLEI